MTNQTQKESWHLSKSVPLTIVLALALQTLSLVVWGAQLQSDVEYNKYNIARIEARQETDATKLSGRIDKIDAVLNGQAVTIARMDQNILYIKEIAERALGKE